MATVLTDESAKAWTRHGSDAVVPTPEQVHQIQLDTMARINAGLRDENARLSAELGRLNAELAERPK